MHMPQNEIVVLDIAGEYARVACFEPRGLLNLAKLGFLSEDDQMVRPILDVSDRQNLVRDLIRLEALFSGGRDWSPAELVDFYREEGVVLTGYRMITWKNLHQYTIVDR